MERLHIYIDTALYFSYHVPISQYFNPIRNSTKICSALV